jgi:hypothetical protein
MHATSTEARSCFGKNYGMHQERGQESVAHIVKMAAGHDLNHLRQIEAILKG